MRQAGVDLLALCPGPDVRYLLGISPLPDERAAYLFLTPVDGEDPVFVVPSVNAHEVSQGIPAGVRVLSYTDDQGPGAALGEALADVGRGAAVAVSAAMRVEHALWLSRALRDRDVRLWPPAALSSQILGPERMRKDPEEIRLLEACARLADQAMQAGWAALRPGATESQVAQAVAQAFAALGAEEVAFTLVAAGPHSAQPHHRPLPHPVRKGEAVFLDIGCTLGGYQSDLTRMAYVGEPDALYRRVHAAVVRAHDAAMEAVRPGVKAEEVDRAARRVLEAEGWGHAFVHRTGHGIGLEGHEPPFLQEGNAQVLEVGMTFSIEPGVYLPGQFGVRVEDVVVVTEDGARPLSNLDTAVYQVPA
jgi:Xaa-Pro aminopeptidase